MKGWEALKAYDEGKKVRYIEWPADNYIERGGRNSVIGKWPVNSSITNFLIGEWEIYEEEPEDTLKCCHCGCIVNAEK